MEKLKSRKFWISVAAFLGSLGTAIAGFTTDNNTVIVIGILCASLSTGIYTICEAVIDKEGEING